MSIYISVFAGSDTVTKIKALSKGKPIPLDDVTRITLTYNGVVVDSDVETEAFEWLNTENTGEIYLKLGSYLTAKNCQPLPARITLYDVLTPNGVVLDEGCQSPSLYISVC